MAFSPLINQLIEALRCLPGVGPKSAQRMAFYILERDRQGGTHLANALLAAVTRVQHCHHCRTLCEIEICTICSNQARNRQILCIVESPADVLAVEQTASFRGVYFVLMGHLSPLDGIGPDEIGIPLLLQRIQQGEIQEAILATNPTVEGEATAHYIANILRQRGIQTTRIAHGVPLGGELEYIDGGTLARALIGRLPIVE